MFASRLLLATTAMSLCCGLATAQCSKLHNSPPGANLGLTDESQRTVALPFTLVWDGVPYDTITVSANGFVWLGDGGPNDYSPTVAEATVMQPRILPLWWDLDPSAGGGVFFDTDMVAQATVVWRDVPEYRNPSVRANFELTLTVSGQITFYYDTDNGLPTLPTVVGISGGGAANQTVLTDWSMNFPGAVDITWNGTDRHATALQGFAPGDLDINNLIAGAGTTFEISPVDLLHRQFNAIGAPNHGSCGNGHVFAGSSEATTIGVGCPQPRTTIHELFTGTGGANAFDLYGLDLRFVRSADSYTLTGGPPFDADYSKPGRGTLLTGVGDDTVTTAALAPMTFQLGTQTPITSVMVGSNGYIWLPSGTAESSPDGRIATSGARIAAFWADLVPDSIAGSAPIYWEATPTFCMATWEHVPVYQDGGSYTFQIKLLANGDIAVSYGPMLGATMRPAMVGLSGGGATNTGAVQLATGGAINTITRLITGAGDQPMTHSVNHPARLGQDFTMMATVPANNLGSGVFGIGLSNPALPLDALFGPGAAPGCTIYTNLATALFIPVPFPIGATSFALTPYSPVPMQLSLQGMVLYTQAAAFVPPGTLNAVGLVTSNGLTFTVGF